MDQIRDVIHSITIPQDVMEPMVDYPQVMVSVHGQDASVVDNILSHPT